MAPKLKILILEDNESDADLLNRELKKSGLSFTSEIVQTRIAFEQALHGFNPDLILSDYSLPSFDAVEAFRIKQNKHPHIPFIIVSGIIGEENAVELIKAGVTDYVSKNKLFTLSTKIDRALNDAEIRKEKILTDKKLKLLNQELLELNQELEARVVHRTKALAESESRFRSMMETIPQIAWTNRINGKVVFYNQRWYNYTGLDNGQTQLRGFKTVVHPEDLKTGFKQFSSILRTNDGGEFQIRVKRMDGLYMWHLIRLMPITDQHGEMQLWVGTATDIQELKLLQQHKDDFIIIASHELKTPITSLKASLQFLDKIKDNPPTPILSKLIGQANKSLGKVNSLIEDLLNSSMASQGQLHINQKHFVLSETIKECCLDIQTEGMYTIKTEGDMQVEVYADIIRIGQIVINFLNNAIKYAPKSKEIRISIEKVNDMAKVSVIDNGPGIPQEKLRYLFDRYYRAENSGSQYTGLGLGLYICAEIIKKHNGQIGVESELDKGSSFWFTLPLHTQSIHPSK
ncbi:PAS domain S-box-containing protein [Pedobacter sp. ok626]|uniref:sensor histidine kinase n=1 Tax=Pedobacter sp. ok626 TaxID=1761882 RepID=UPI00088AAA47|nr:ATP-binding protein [Pedobacter sp. ok626]SDL59522.1 PAS domain S-box-containing protein [Pedobacter sp. ok626]